MAANKKTEYCPYCDKDIPIASMTDEHVIPESIGGDDRTKIRACKPCNNTAGSKIDTLLSRFSGLRVMGLFFDRVLGRQERHESRAVLKDGRELEGYFYMERVGNREFRVAFQPAKNQRDGSIWISEHAANPNLPKGINVYRQEMLDMASYTVADPSTAGLEPALIKILLGVMYMAHGSGILRHPSFAPLRQSLKGTMPSQITFDWLNSPEQLLLRYPRFTMGKWDHVVWGASDGMSFKGGIRLFGVIAEITITPFSHLLPGQILTVPSGVSV